MFRWRCACVAVMMVLGASACGGPAGGDKVKETVVSLPKLAGEAPRNLAPTTLEPEDVLLVGGTVMTATGEALEGGSVLLRGGKIEAVSAERLEAPEGVRVLDVSGKFVTPGIIDTHSHLGVYASPGLRAHSDGNEATGATTGHVSAAHGVWPQDPGFYKALSGGVTTQMVIPGSANLVGGRGVTLKSHPGISTRAMLFEQAPEGLKMACGENPKRVYGAKGREPMTRMGNMAGWRKIFQRAVEYREGLLKHERAMAKWESGPKKDPSKKPSPPARNLELETLVAVMEGEILVHIHCYRADEMLQLLELAEAYGFEVRSFHHAVEAYKIRDVLAAWDVSVSTWADWWGFKAEAHDAILENAALLHVAGARAIIHSDSPVGIQRLNQEAAKAYYAGLEAGLEIPQWQALRWITANAAWALGVDELTGTLEVGKQADVVVWSAHPFSVYAQAELVYVDGVREFDLSAPAPPWSDFEVYSVPQKDEAPAAGAPGEVR